MSLPHSSLGARAYSESTLGPSVTSIWHQNRKKRKLVSKLTELTRLPLNIVELLGKANVFYFSGKNVEAVAQLLEVLRLAPRLPDCYDTLAMIFDDMGEHYMAYKIYLYKTMNIKQITTASWERVAYLAYKLNYKDHCLEALRRSLLFKNITEANYLKFLKMKALLHLEVKQFQAAVSALSAYASKEPQCYNAIGEFANCCDYYGYQTKSTPFHLMYTLHFMGTVEVDQRIWKHFKLFSRKNMTYYVNKPFNSLSEIDKSLFFHSIRKFVDFALEMDEKKDQKDEERLASYGFVINYIMACFSYTLASDARNSHTQMITGSSASSLSRYASYLPCDIVMVLCWLKLISYPESEEGVMQEINFMNYKYPTYLSDIVSQDHYDYVFENENVEEEEEEDDSESNDEAPPKTLKDPSLNVKIPSFKAGTAVIFFEKLSAIKQAVRLANEFMEKGLVTRSSKLADLSFSNLEVFMSQSQALQPKLLAIHSNDCDALWRQLARLYLSHKNCKSALKCCLSILDYHSTLGERSDIHTLELALEITRKYQELSYKTKQIMDIFDIHYNLFQLEYSNYINNRRIESNSSASNREDEDDSASSDDDNNGDPDIADDSDGSFGDNGGGRGRTGVSKRRTAASSSRRSEALSGDFDSDDSDDAQRGVSNFKYDKENKVFRSALTEEVFGEHNSTLLIELLTEFVEKGSVQIPPHTKDELIYKSLSLYTLDCEVNSLLSYSKILFEREMYDRFLIYSYTILLNWFNPNQYKNSECFIAKKRSNRTNGSSKKRNGLDYGESFENMNSDSEFDLSDDDVGEARRGNRRSAGDGEDSRRKSKLKKNKDRKLVSLSIKDFDLDVSLIGEPPSVLCNDKQSLHLFWFLNALISTTGVDLNSVFARQVIEELFGQFKTCAEKCFIISDRSISNFIDTCCLELNRLVPPIIVGKPSSKRTNNNNNNNNNNGNSNCVSGTLNNDGILSVPNEGSVSYSSRPSKDKAVDAASRSTSDSSQVSRMNSTEFMDPASVSSSFTSFNNNSFIISCSDVSIAAGIAAERIWKNPNDIAAGNILFRELANYTKKSASAINIWRDYNSIINIPSFIRKHPRSFLAQTLGGIVQQTRAPGESLMRFIDSFCLNPDDPLNCLCISSFLSSSAKMSKACRILAYPHIKSLLFLEKYKSGRMKFLEDISEITEVLKAENNQIMMKEGSESNLEFDHKHIVGGAVIRMEIEYNFGRTFHSMGLTHLALNHYMNAIHIGEFARAEEATEGSGIFELMKQSAFNAVLILKGCDALEEAFELTSKYLTI